MPVPDGDHDGHVTRPRAAATVFATATTSASATATTATTGSATTSASATTGSCATTGSAVTCCYQPGIGVELSLRAEIRMDDARVKKATR
jgi:hypothetical protein